MLKFSDFKKLTDTERENVRMMLKDLQERTDGKRDADSVQQLAREKALADLWTKALEEDPDAQEKLRDRVCETTDSKVFTMSVEKLEGYDKAYPVKEGTILTVEIQRISGGDYKPEYTFTLRGAEPKTDAFKLNQPLLMLVNTTKGTPRQKDVERAQSYTMYEGVQNPYMFKQSHAPNVHYELTIIIDKGSV